MSTGPPTYQGRLVLRNLVFAVGLFLITLGVAVSARASLGTTPISTPTYVVGLIGWMSFGTATILLNTVFVLAQIALLRRRFRPFQLLQVPVGIVFGLLIDVSMWLTPWIRPEAYWLQWVTMLAGCVLVAVGVVVQLLPRVLVNPGDGLISTLSATTGVLIGNTKVLFDVTMVALGALLSWVWFGRLEGVREGTVVAMFLVGILVGRLMPPLDRWFGRLMER